MIDRLQDHYAQEARRFAELARETDDPELQAEYIHRSRQNAALCGPQALPRRVSVAQWRMFPSDDRLR
jgi:hypothetical protein